jgi:hypothetical protein
MVRFGFWVSFVVFLLKANHMRYLKFLSALSALIWAQSPSWGRAYVDSAASVVPQYIVSPVTNTNTRVPYVAYLVIRGLEPNTTYRYVVRMDDNTTPATSLNINLGAGNPIYYDASSNNFTRTATPSLNTAGNYGTITTVVENGMATARLIFIIEATGNARFRTDKTLYPKVFLREDAAGNDSAVVYAEKTPVEPIAFGSSCPNQDTCGSFLYDSITPSLVNSKFVFLYDTYLLGPNPTFKRPITGAIVEPSVSNLATNGSYLLAFRNEVASKSGRWGTIVPNTLPNGIRSIVYHERGHTLVSSPLANVGIYDRDGQWPSGYNTANPNNGPAAVSLLMSLTQPLRPVTGIRPPDAFERGLFIWRNLGTNPLCPQCDGFIYVTNDHLLTSASPLSFPYSESCAYSLGLGQLPSPPADSTLPPTSWGIVGGPGWAGAFGDSIRISPQLLRNPGSGEFLWPITTPPLNNCSSQPASCQEIFVPAGAWKWKLHPVAFSNEAGNLVRNYKYGDQMGSATMPFHQTSLSGPFSVPGTPVGLTETSGADLNNLNTNTTTSLTIRALLPYDIQVYPAFPFEFNQPNTGYLQWDLVRVSNNSIIGSGSSQIPFGTNSCGAPSNNFNECAYQTNVSVSGLTLGTYRIRGRIIPPVCPNAFSPMPIETDSLTFVVTVTTALASSAQVVPVIRTTPTAWHIDGVSGQAMLYDAQGRQLWSGFAEQGALSISRQDLRPGLYLLVVETPTGPFIHRLLHLTE